jgi:hypothetical protein
MGLTKGLTAIALAALALCLALPGCGGATITSDEIIKSLELTKRENATNYTVGGDVFCEIRGNLLDTEQKIQAAKAKKNQRRYLVVNPSGSAGVILVSPFEASCKQRVVDGMQTVK